MSNILVISPHPDDEAIGCGGAISHHTRQGDTVDVIFLTSGEKGGHGRLEEETKTIREAEAKAAGKILGISNINFWKQPDGAFEATKDCVDRMVTKIKSFQPSIIYVTHDGEMHPDHKAAALLVRSALGQLNNTMNVEPAVWMYEVWTPIQQIDHVIDISDYVEIKQQAIRAHKCQCDVLRFDIAALSLNRYRGEMHSWPGGEYAEVFKDMIES